jgi:hypothetical protein
MHDFCILKVALLLNPRCNYKGEGLSEKDKERRGKVVTALDILYFNM